MILKLTIDRFEGDQAVLITADQQKIIWPKKKLPNGTNEGASLLFFISENPQEDKAGRELAKEILNEILNPEQS